MHDRETSPIADVDVEQARAGLMLLAGGDPCEFAVMLKIMAETLREHAAKLVAAATADDRRQVHFHGHALKGSVRTAGMHDLGALAEAVEFGARSLGAAQLQTHATTIAGRVEAVLRALKA